MTPYGRILRLEREIKDVKKGLCCIQNDPACCGGINPQSETTYTVTTEDIGKIVTLSNTNVRTVTLPAASTFPIGYIVWLKDAALTALSNNVQFAPTGADLIEGSNTTQSFITTNGGAKGVYSDGTSWFLI